MFVKRYVKGVKALKYTYFKAEKAINEEVVFFQFADSIELFYDTNGKLESLYNLDSGESYRFTYENNKLVCIEKFQNDKLILIDNIKYDKSDRIIEENIQELIRNEISKYQYISYNYTNNTNVIRSTTNNLSCDYLETRIFNDNKQLLILKIEDDNGINTYTKSAYDKQGRLKSDTYLGMDNPIEVSYYQNGLMKSYGNASFKYKFDDKGNWCNKFKYNEFGLVHKLVRDIKYH